VPLVLKINGKTNIPPDDEWAFTSRVEGLIHRIGELDGFTMHAHG